MPTLHAALRRRLRVAVSVLTVRASALQPALLPPLERGDWLRLSEQLRAHPTSVAGVELLRKHALELCELAVSLRLSPAAAPSEKPAHGADLPQPVDR